MEGMIDREKLLEFLAKRAREAPPGGDPGLLVQHSIYEGLANRVKSGEFDLVVIERPDLEMESRCGDPDTHDRKDTDA